MFSIFFGKFKFALPILSVTVKPISCLVQIVFMS